MLNQGQRRRDEWYGVWNAGYDQMAILLSAIKESKKSVDLKLETFREELKWSSSEASDRLERKLRANKPMEFRRKGNETQHAFNEELDRHLDEIEEELDSARLQASMGEEITSR